VALQAALEGVKMLKNLHEKINSAALVLGLVAGCAVLAGCQTEQKTSDSPPPSVLAALNSGSANAGPASTPTPTPAPAPAPAPDNSPSMMLHEGDTVKISFPGAPTLDTAQKIRDDGKITLAMVGEMKAAGMTPHELELQLLKAYDAQLVVKEVSVTVEAAVFQVYVTGAVLRPGKLISERVETPLEAVIEAGIDHNRANLKKVRIVREENGQTKTFTLNLDAVLKGKPTKPFTLKPMDKIYVPEKFMWY